MHVTAHIPRTMESMYIDHPLRSLIISLLNTATTTPLFARTITSITRHLRETRLMGWIYYDPFLRFLHAIGPRNASLITSLRFSGSSTNNQNLVSNLYIYIPIIRALCTTLSKLVIKTQEGQEARRAHRHEQALLPFLTNQLRMLTSLDKLVVLERGEELENDNEEERGPRHVSAEWVRETADWVVKQGEERRKREFEEEGKMIEEEEKAKGAETKIFCEFCGEDHLWPEYYRLCSLCGEYGHFQPTCPHWDEFRRDAS